MNRATAVPKAAEWPESSATMGRLAGVLLASLEELAAAGRVEAACRLAGQAYATLRRSDREAARRFDVLLHRLTRRLSW